MSTETPDVLETLLKELNAGDFGAAERVFVECEPILRRMVRRQQTARMRAKFDSVDIVLSVWVDLLRGFRDAEWHFADSARLKAFIVQVTQNRFVDHVRRHQTAMRIEEPLDINSAQDRVSVSQEPSPSQVAQADDVWNQLMALCSPEHREIIRMKKAGFSAREIASHTQLHEDSIRRILRDLAKRLALAGMPVLSQSR